MPNASRPAWTVGRKLAGNLVPLAFALPLLILGVRSYPATGMAGPTLTCFVLFPIVGWLATNFFGPCGSWGMKSIMGKKLHNQRPFDKVEKILVGFARPSYRGLLDPHEDVGFLLFFDDRLEFFGSTADIVISKSEIKGVGFRANPHTWLGLGRWVCVEAESGGKPLRFLIEPRERATLFGNLMLGTKVAARIKKWAIPGSLAVTPQS